MSFPRRRESRTRRDPSAVIASKAKQSLSIQDSLGLKQTESGFDRFKVANLGNSPARTLSGASQISALSPRLSALAIGILLLLTPIAHAELENFQAADVVLGQPSFTSNTANNGGVSARSMSQSQGIFSDGKRLFVADGTNARMLIWNKIPTANTTPGDVVIGQPGFTTNAANNDGGVTARSLSGAVAQVFLSKGKLFVSDQGNNRVLIWNTVPSTNFTPADVVVGQPNFTSNTANNGGISARSFGGIRGVTSDGQRLFVNDQSNHRILIWNHIPTTNFAPADIVLGQPDFISNTANNGGISARSLSTPRNAYSNGKQLFVTEAGNNRLLIWNTIPTTNFAPADVVLGQPNFNQGTANNGGVSARSLSGCRDLSSDGKRLFVSDSSNRRTLIWNNIPTSNFTPADIVLGQPDFNSNTANNGGVSARSANTTGGAFSDGKRLFIGDPGNNRVLIFNISGFTPSPDPQFEQGKAVVGKVFNDINGNGIQDSVSRPSFPHALGGNLGGDRSPTKDFGDDSRIPEPGLEGVKIVSDTGIYAITDQDGKYHFPYIETGQHVLKLDESTLPEGSTLTTDNPYKATITKGILTKVSFGVRLPESSIEQRVESIGKPSADLPLLEVSITQDTSTKPIKKLGITAEIIDQQDVRATPGGSPVPFASPPPVTTTYSSKNP